MAIEVTEEMRQAVYEADCDVKGHAFQIGDLFHSQPVPAEQRDAVGNPFKKVLGSHEDDKLPSISCGRCNKVWLVIEDPGSSYDDAVTKLKNRVKDPDSIKPIPKKAKDPKDPGAPKPNAIPHTH